jgi:probable HAF family extracellular repeat protein
MLLSKFSFHPVRLPLLASGVLLGLCIPGRECAAQAPQPSYKIVDLGPTLVRAVVDTPGLNDHGDAALWLSVDGSRTHAVLLNGTQSTEIEGIPGFTVVYPTDISNSGTIVGALQDPRDMRFTRAFRWDSGKLQLLKPLDGKDFAANAINQHGEIVGKALTGSGVFHAVIWKGDGVQDLGTLPHGDFSEARDVNNQGVVIGASNITPNGKPHAFIWRNGQMQELPDVPGGTLCGAQAINDKAETVGYCELPSGNAHAVLWRGKKVIDLGPLGEDLDDAVSTAVDINNHSQIVGFYAIEDGKLVAFLWQNGKMLDLNKLLPPGSDWRLVMAWRINDSGEIIGRGFHEDGMHVFRLVPQAASSVPK